MKHAIILASQSPRRQELLRQLGLQFSVIPSDYDEQLDDTRSVEAVAKELALGKAMDVARQHPEAVVIGADTIVSVDDTQLGKPVSVADAHDMLRLQAGRATTVTTGMAVVFLNDNIKLVAADQTQVVFKPYDKAAIDAYIATGEPMDKAGAYGIQGGGRELIERVEGDVDTVIGLNTKRTMSLLRQCAEGLPLSS